jgi:hypothetical protein
MRLLKPAGLVVVSFLMGVAVTRYYDVHRAAPQLLSAVKAPEQPATPQLQIDFQNEPLWAYGFEEPAKPGDTALPQNPPTRNLRPRIERI